ncbi:MAG: PDZ domain-containing protein [Myxococcales bacterium]|nr:PDZ domain-containing protein [Myxococcales bacterium]
MERLTKRYFWVINLVLLAVLAWLSARVINNIVAGEIVALPTRPRPPAPVEPARADSNNSRSDWAAAINNRNLFNSAPPEPDEDTGDGGVTEPDDGEVNLDGVPGEGDECKKSEASIGLAATMVAEPAEWSMAVVDDGQAPDARLVREGQRLSDFVVAAIQRERIVLAKGSAFECVELGERKMAKGNAGRTIGAAPTEAPAASSKIRDGVKKTGANAYEIDRQMLNEQLEDLNALSRQARVIPHYRDGKPQGFKIVGVRPGSLYSQIGVRSGDILKSVNGEEISSPNKALELYEKLKNSDNVAVDVERRGRKVTLDYQIK